MIVDGVESEGVVLVLSASTRVVRSVTVITKDWSKCCMLVSCCAMLIGSSPVAVGAVVFPVVLVAAAGLATARVPVGGLVLSWVAVMGVSSLA